MIALPKSPPYVAAMLRGRAVIPWESLKMLGNSWHVVRNMWGAARIIETPG
jgi:hypothetical protein